jgi:hypothetical protein
MRVLICICLILAANSAVAATAVCEIDLQSGTFDWTTAEGQRLDRVRLRDAARQFEQLASLLAQGDPADSLRATLGRTIIAPVWKSISEATAWRIVPLEVRALPGPLGAFGILTLPDGTSALERVSVSLDWPRPLRTPVPRPNESSGALLLSAPFTADVDPSTDDPDTLRRALGKAARTVRLIPRNETGVSTLRAALEEARPAVWWFRGESGALAGMQPAFGALPNVVVWTLPSRTKAGPPRLSPMTLASGGESPACVIVATRAVSETALASMARRLVDGIARGLDCATALHEAQRAALQSGLPLVASSMILVGDPLTEAGLARAPWLRRIFR